MKLQDIRDLSAEEIKAHIADARKQIVELRFQQALRKLESPARLRNAKKLLAQLLTIETEKANAAAAAK
ncbi:50S ribosomal protein L29 [Candidatus Obscuribacterales bacterium]|jgi:large subunit ribosomal protein L29|nr:50S ribosomal protein L29 [Candidatus Obscuribacterales bacterium]MBX3138683.1 50S ribosomal protein L29 [Candidatus Obscuribacterales bacterium]MBX3154149.1 50S ribosomal protein L29 [Candidatus Obscuribacterales bacterium]